MEGEPEPLRTRARAARGVRATRNRPGLIRHTVAHTTVGHSNRAESRSDQFFVEKGRICRSRAQSSPRAAIGVGGASERSVINTPHRTRQESVGGAAHAASLATILGRLSRHSGLGQDCRGAAGLRGYFPPCLSRGCAALRESMYAVKLEQAVDKLLIGMTRRRGCVLGRKAGTRPSPGRLIQPTGQSAVAALSNTVARCIVAASGPRTRGVKQAGPSGTR